MELKTATLLAFAFLAIGLTPRSRMPAQVQSSQQQLEDQIASKLEAAQTDAALDLARAAAAQYPQSSVLHQLLGISLFKKGRKEEARRAFQKAIELDSTLAPNYYNLSLLELSESRYGQAAAALEACLRLEPQNAQARLLLGRAYHNLNRTLLAVEQFKKALAVEPSLPLAHYHLGYAFQSQGELAAALAEFKEEIRINPRFYDAYWLAGNIELGRENLEAAGQLFQRAIALKPEAFEAHYGLGRLFLAKKQYNEAESELKIALGARPDNVEVHYALARTYQLTGRQQEARREYQVCSELNARSQKRRSGIAGKEP